MAGIDVASSQITRLETGAAGVHPKFNFQEISFSIRLPIKK